MLIPKKPTKASGGQLNAGIHSLKRKAILTDRGGRAPRLMPAKTPPSGATHPGIFVSGKRARPTGSQYYAPRIIATSAAQVAPVLSGTLKLF
jgi:hypothetical protein